MKVATDWKGNEINIGDTVLLYEYRTIFTPTEETAIGQILMYGEKKIQTEPEVYKTPYSWDLYKTIKIVEPKELDSMTFTISFEVKQPEEVIEEPINWFGLNQQEEFCCAICIKGVSDNKDEFLAYRRKEDQKEIEASVDYIFEKWNRRCRELPRKDQMLYSQACMIAFAQHYHESQKDKKSE